MCPWLSLGGLIFTGILMIWNINGVQGLAGRGRARFAPEGAARLACACRVHALTTMSLLLHLSLQVPS